jgi:hypothetical protein
LIDRDELRVEKRLRVAPIRFLIDTGEQSSMRPLRKTNQIYGK